MSAQKALQGSEKGMRELLGETIQRKVFPRRGFLTKRKQKIIELVSRPGSGGPSQRRTPEQRASSSLGRGSSAAGNGGSAPSRTQGPVPSQHTDSST